jgi:hypothetical protein
LEKQDDSKVVIDEGRVIKASELQSEKQQFGIVVTPFGIIISESDEHLEKQNAFKKTIDEGRLIEESELQSEKHDSGIMVTFLGMVICESFSHPEKHRQTVRDGSSQRFMREEGRKILSREQH